MITEERVRNDGQAIACRPAHLVYGFVVLLVPTYQRSGANIQSFLFDILCARCNLTENNKDSILCELITAIENCILLFRVGEPPIITLN